jgi:NhaB family Na+:H+ antiporter
LHRAIFDNFLGGAPEWYKALILGFLILNPLLVVTIGGFVTGWIFVAEFILTLAMALKCYPLQPGGLLVIEAVLLRLTTPEALYRTTEHNFPVILLLIFMVAGIYFLRDMLTFAFTRLLLGVRSKRWLALLFCAAGALLSAFLDALTVVAVVMTVVQGFYEIYHRVASSKGYHHDHDASDDRQVPELHREDLDEFRAFLRSLIMHAAVGTALGGVTTMVGEPQNLLIAKEMGWDFRRFFVEVAPVSMPVLGVGLLTCLALEWCGRFGYGAQLHPSVRAVLVDYERHIAVRRTRRDDLALLVQATCAVILVVALAFHVAEVGVVGLLIIVLATALNGVTEEQRLGPAFQAALPFTALLVVFFGVVAVISDQNLFRPVTEAVLGLEGQAQAVMLYVANGLLSAVSDNVFVASVYISQVKEAYVAGHFAADQLDKLGVAINTGTNIPSVATPNGQAAFLFLLTSSLAPLIRLSYGRMVWMALPYTVTMTVTGLLAVRYLL